MKSSTAPAARLRPAWRSARQVAALIALAGSAAGSLACASGTSGLALSQRERIRIQIAERGLNPADVVLPFEVNDQMRTWVRERVKTGGEPTQRLEQLLQALLHRDGVELSYQRGYTATATEVWETHKANCLSFTHLYVGLAREIGLPVYYLRVSDLQSFEKDGDLVVASEHVTAAHGPPTHRHVLDFSDRPVKDYRQTEPISDLRAVALHYSNLGAHRIRDDRTDEAIELLETAIRLDPELADGWINLGVAMRRVGDLATAEAYFRRALELDPSATSGYTNLASVLQRQGRDAEAARVLALTDRFRSRNPFSYLALGDLALREGRLDEAERYFRRAQRLDPESAETLAALGQWALAAGRRHAAQRWLRKAEQVDPAEPRVADLARSLRAPTRQG
jgi:Flp pilus assembly protein TadD